MFSQLTNNVRTNNVRSSNQSYCLEQAIKSFLLFISRLRRCYTLPFPIECGICYMIAFFVLYK